MVIKKLDFKDLINVVNLEKTVYPEYLCLGYDDYWSDFYSAIENLSLGVYTNNKLIGYIIAYKNKTNKYYISDLVCKNPKALINLLKEFQSQNKGKKFFAELRSISKLMIEKIQKLYPNNITIIKLNKMDMYYEFEDGYYVEFEII